jgi:hypothetical protein
VKNGKELDAEMGWIVTRQALECIEGYNDIGVKEGAMLVVDGDGLKLKVFESGFFTGYGNVVREFAWGRLRERPVRDIRAGRAAPPVSPAMCR